MQVFPYVSPYVASEYAKPKTMADVLQELLDQ